jgi:hypothetical protein
VLYTPKYANRKLTVRRRAAFYRQLRGNVFQQSLSEPALVQASSQRNSLSAVSPAQKTGLNARLTLPGSGGSLEPTKHLSRISRPATLIDTDADMGESLPQDVLAVTFALHPHLDEGLR